jgi:hypothetical protein
VDLDSWLDNPQIRTHHRQEAGVPPEALWAAASEIRVGDAPRLGRLLRWRIPDTPADRLYRDVFRRYPFVVLEEGEDWSVSGLCGRIWTLRRDYPSLDSAQEFREWDEAGTVRVVLGHWIEAGEDGSALVSEARIEPVDRRARWRVRALWSTLGRFQGLIGREALTAAARRAESSS